MKEQKTRKELQAKLQMKDTQLNNFMEKQRLLQEQLEQVKGQVPEIKEENSHLAKEKINLEHQLERQHFKIREMQDQLDDLRTQTQTERRSRASVAFKITENIAQEREGLVQ